MWYIESRGDFLNVKFFIKIWIFKKVLSSKTLIKNFPPSKRDSKGTFNSNSDAIYIFISESATLWKLLIKIFESKRDFLEVNFCSNLGFLNKFFNQKVFLKSIPPSKKKILRKIWLSKSDAF